MAKRILVVQTAFLGDLLLGVPLLTQIRSRWPDAEIDLVCRTGVGSLLLEAKLIHRLFEIVKKNSTSYGNVKKILQLTDYEYIFCPHQSFTSARLVRGLRARKKIGFRRWWNGIFFDCRVVLAKDLPDPLRQISLLAPLFPELDDKILEFQKKQSAWNSSDGLLAPIPDWAAGFWNWPWSFSEVAKKFGLGSGVIAVFPGSVWATKRWTEQGFVELAKTLLKNGEAIVILGGPEEFALCKAIADQCPGAINLAGKTSLQETLTILKGAKLAISNDSAGQHLASLVNCPTVSIFGPTIPEFGFRPWNSRAIVVQSPLACRPCGKHGHHECPLHTHDCMKKIEAKQVLTAVQQFKEFSL